MDIDDEDLLETIGERVLPLLRALSELLVFSRNFGAISATVDHLLDTIGESYLSRSYDDAHGYVLIVKGALDSLLSAVQRRDKRRHPDDRDELLEIAKARFREAEALLLAGRTPPKASSNE
jgi:hypothetical protein